MNTILWFQRDLRLNCNPALNWALKHGNPIIAVFVYSPEEDQPWQSGPASNWWLHNSLRELSKELLQHGIKLYFFKGNSTQIIPELISTFKANAICWTNRHEPKRIQYEAEIDRKLNNEGLVVKRFQDELLKEANDFVTKTHKTPYKIFTPFYKRLRHELALSGYSSDVAETQWPENLSSPVQQYEVGSNLEQLNLLDTNDWSSKLFRHWDPGEKAALKKLDFFVEKNLDNYSHNRDIPGIDGTSTLSAHLHFGEIAPGQILAALSPYISYYDGNRTNNSESFLRQLIWREFARYILRHFPDTANEPMNKKFSASFWQFDPYKLEQWQQGNTGVPIIDAGMRQLWETGWMHNRVRMLAASFLTKNLGIPWQEGARWFWHTLVDADLANNSMGWQWVSGCGVDAAPYFRIFNPYTQTQRFDKHHSYIKRWQNICSQNSATQPMIDVGQSRKDALSRYKRYMRGSSVSDID